MSEKSLRFVIYLLSFLFIFALFVFHALAWQEPTLLPPGNNAPAPLNVSAVPQGKLGSLGLGLSTPLSRLHLRDGQTWGTDLSLDAQGTTGGRRWLLISTGGIASEGQGKFLIKDDNANQVRLTIDTQGNVGIGTKTPSAKLEIAGNLKVIDKTEVGRYVNWRLDQTSDPADAPEGTIYYNKQSGVFRCKIPSGWVD